MIDHYLDGEWVEPLESGQIQPLGLSHAIGPPGWRPYFQRGIPSILKRLKHPKPDHQSLPWPFPLAPPSPPPAPPPWPKDPLPADSRDPDTSRRGPGGNAPNFCAQRCWRRALPVPSGPSGPPWAPLGPPPPGPPGPPPFWAPCPGPFGSRDKCLPVLAAKAEVGIEGASPKP